MESVYDFQKNSLYRDRVETYFIDRHRRNLSMSESHYHPYFELFYVAQGNCKMFVEHSLFNCKSGDLLILPEGTLHRSQYEKTGSVERITLSFTQKFAFSVDEFFTSEVIFQEFPLKKIHFNEEKRTELEKLFDRLLGFATESDEILPNLKNFQQNEQKNLIQNDLKLESKYEKLQVKSLILQIFLEIFAASKNSVSEEQQIDEVSDKIQECAKYIFENYSQDLKLADVASIAGMSDTYFSKKFHDVSGYSFKEYLTNIRIQHAIKMLQTSRLSVTQIATACGFGDGNYFGDAFRKKNGVSPSEFRKKLRKK